MKRHTSILLIAGLCLFALFSCKPIEYPAALNRTAVTDSPLIYVTPHAKKADVAFTPVRNADSYNMTIQEKNGEPSTISVPMKVKEGLYTFTVRKLDPETEYTITVTAMNTEGSKSTAQDFKTTVDNGELDYAPVAYMSKRDETTATITVNKRKGIEYRVSWNDGTEWKELKEDGETGNYNLIGLNNDKSYKVNVEHRKSSSTVYSSDNTELVIPKDRKAFDDSVTIIQNGTKLSVSDTKSKKLMTLLFYPDGSGVPIQSESVELSLKDSIDISAFGPFTSGLFDIVLSNSATDADMVFSQPTYLTVPVLPSVDTMASNQKSVTLTWNQPENIEEVIYTVYGESTDSYKWKITPSDVEIVGNRATLKLDDLVSNTDYNITIEAELSNGESSKTTFPFTTDSFSGVDRWVCQLPGKAVSSFVIEVWDHDDAEMNNWSENWNDKYPYHVFVHKTDPAYDKSMEGISIMPLFREGDPQPTEFIQYSENDTHYKQAYHWNEMKWNATGKIHPSAWLPDSKRDSFGPDTRTSYTLSKALGTLTTKTDFTFRVVDGKPQIVFRNAGEGKGAGTVNIGLFKNPQPEPGTDQFTFVLNRIGSVEQRNLGDK